MLNCNPVEATGYGSEEIAVISTGCHGDMARAHSALAFADARTSKTSVTFPSTAAAMKTTISASSWGKVSAFLYYVAIAVSTFFVPLASVEYISWSEIYKYVGVSILVGQCQLCL